MKATKILFATDFSESSDAAKALATAIARDARASLLIVHVIEPPPHSVDTGFGGHVVEAEDEAAAHQLLSETLPTDPDVAHAHRLLHGTPAKEIVNCANEEGVDMIVIGSHGRRGLMHMLVGSVAEGVVRKANCPVLTIKQPSNIVDDA